MVAQPLRFDQSGVLPEVEGRILDDADTEIKKAARGVTIDGSLVSGGGQGWRSTIVRCACIPVPLRKICTGTLRQRSIRLTAKRGQRHWKRLPLQCIFDSPPRKAQGARSMHCSDTMTNILHAVLKGSFALHLCQRTWEARQPDAHPATHGRACFPHTHLASWRAASSTKPVTYASATKSLGYLYR